MLTYTLEKRNRESLYEQLTAVSGRIFSPGGCAPVRDFLPSGPWPSIWR